jgi:uncharacterized protein YrzB (UPF0473 family)
MNAEAFKMLEENYSEEWRNEAYAMVLEQVGKFIEKNDLRRTNFPKRANEALYILALGLAKNNLLFKGEEGEKYLVKQLERIRDGGFDIIEEIFNEIVKK